MSESLVTFKGNKEGIYIQVKEGSFQTIKEQLDQKLRNAGGFFKGVKAINLKSNCLTFEEKEELKNMIEGKYGIVLDNSLLIEEKEEVTPIPEQSFYDGIYEGNTNFIRTTIRSGQVIEYDGNIVILGDVNPGGEIIAKGNIVVLGTLRGVAIAGSDGNKEAIVAAFSLQPTQLRIAGIIGRCPDNEALTPKWPEIASVKDNIVIVEPYLPKK